MPKSTVITYGRKKKNINCVYVTGRGQRGQHLGVGGTRVATPNNSHWSRPCIILGLKDSGQGREHTSDTTEKGTIGREGQGLHEMSE